MSGEKHSILRDNDSDPTFSAGSLVQGLLRNSPRSNLSITLGRNGLRIRFRPFTYDPIVLYSVLVEQIYGVPNSEFVVVDVGAHIGVFSILAASHRVQTVLSFEPESSNFQLLSENIRINQFESVVKPYRLAIWSHDCSKTMYFSKGTAFHTFFPGRKNPGSPEEIQCRGINSVLDQLAAPVMIKIDAEGSEHSIITSITNQNAEKIERIAMEYHVGNPDLRLYFSQIVDWLVSHGYDVLLHGRWKTLTAIKRPITR